MNVEDLKMPNGSSFVDYLKNHFTEAETEAWTQWTQGHEANRCWLAEVLLPQLEPPGGPSA